MRESDCALILQKSSFALTKTEVERQYDTNFLSKLESAFGGYVRLYYRGTMLFTKYSIYGYFNRNVITLTIYVDHGLT